MKKIRIIPFLLLILSCSQVQAESSQLDQVLAELQKLNEGLRRVENRLDEVEKQVVAMASDPAGPPSVAAGSGTDGTFMERVVDAVQFREQQVNFPWMEKSLWDNLEMGSSPDEVKAILGEPTLEDPSLHKRIDFVYTYRGRKPSNGELIVGKVKFYKGKVAAIEAP